ncbi:hypothetical protein GCM10025870_28350 [Agromyces marinus]|uniref:Uncharacterized protein n=1 Tax=Agromyces marinus TaxID=1389020 RepID=A0ABM8H4N3_9MICO|nr:hypothetical protein [Agromyces marinus]BDZ55762.1 hypothetical protein GCM10025870_28350 [Agromyces marinus]
MWGVKWNFPMPVVRYPAFRSSWVKNGMSGRGSTSFATMPLTIGDRPFMIALRLGPQIGIGV